MKTYFDEPTQVKYLNLDGVSYLKEYKYLGAIAYKDELICGCCGRVFKLEDLYSESEKLNVAPRVPVIDLQYWVDIADSIRGED